MSRQTVRLNTARTIADDAQVLVRLGLDHNPRQALGLAARNAPLYAGFPGAAAGGLVCVSVWAVADERQLEQLVAEFSWNDVGLTSAGAVRSHGFAVLATDVFVEDQPSLFNDWHHDVVIGAYPAHLSDYNDLGKDGKKVLVAELLDPFTRVLRLFDPRGPLPRHGWWEQSETGQSTDDGGTL